MKEILSWAAIALLVVVCIIFSPFVAVFYAVWGAVTGLGIEWDGAKAIADRIRNGEKINKK